MFTRKFIILYAVFLFVFFTSIELYFLTSPYALFFTVSLFPLFSILLVLLLPSYFRLASIFVSFFNCFNVLYFSVVKFDFNNPSIQFYSEFKISQSFNLYYSLGVDVLSLAFIVLTVFLIFVSVISIWVNTINIQQNLALIFTVQFLLLQVFSVLDIFFFFMFYEFVLFPMFLIIGGWGSRSQKIYAAYLFFYYTFAGSVLMLFSLIYIHVNVGSTSYIALLSHKFSVLEQSFIFLGFFLSFASKLPIYPFHVWLPEAHVEAPTSASVLLAGILLKMGGYGLIRWCLSFFMDASVFFAPIVNTLCLVSIFYASFAALCQLDIKRIIAYSSIVHMSYSTLGIFSFNDVALTGSIFGMITHGVISAGLFLSVGVLYDRYGTRSILSYGGLARYMPTFDAIFFVFVLSNMAFPGTGGFISEFLTMIGVYKTFPLAIVILLFGVFLTGVFSLWLYTRIFFGLSNLNVSGSNCFRDGYIKGYADLGYSAECFIPFVGYIRLVNDLSYREFSFFIPLILVNFFFGIFPAFFTSVVNSWAIAFF